MISKDDNVLKKETIQMIYYYFVVGQSLLEYKAMNVEGNTQFRWTTGLGFASPYKRRTQESHTFLYCRIIYYFYKISPKLCR